ncbi:hypothetical protein EIN_504210 [Entamoeba invadens IP1]|uniref:Uncharacterized protein n=1 Tax=Entamoeba invadens IP1 TaxID=370355 RepID=A0A0A1UAS3_ENTIV|nr:hypothetical protein EIN_504210 [Entamoeba invadens IP1]ELP90285.1 hypothetical protein EIN_504210 [Entamoeba invadens IP1]|eukprot:XP_004257056.1 hypothetical protein EIN_504210 [Entamoeba invadens IP1]
MDYGCFKTTLFKIIPVLILSTFSYIRRDSLRRIQSLILIYMLLSLLFFRFSQFIVSLIIFITTQSIPNMKNDVPIIVSSPSRLTEEISSRITLKPFRLPKSLGNCRVIRRRGICNGLAPSTKSSTRRSNRLNLSWTCWGVSRVVCRTLRLLREQARVPRLCYNESWVCGDDIKDVAFIHFDQLRRCHFCI